MPQVLWNIFELARNLIRDATRGYNKPLDTPNRPNKHHVAHAETTS